MVAPEIQKKQHRRWLVQQKFIVKFPLVATSSMRVKRVKQRSVDARIPLRVDGIALPRGASGTITGRVIAIGMTNGDKVTGAAGMPAGRDRGLAMTATGRRTTMRVTTKMIGDQTLGRQPGDNNKKPPQAARLARDVIRTEEPIDVMKNELPRRMVEPNDDRGATYPSESEVPRQMVERRDGQDTTDFSENEVPRRMVEQKDDVDPINPTEDEIAQQSGAAGSTSLATTGASRPLMIAAMDGRPAGPAPQRSSPCPASPARTRTMLEHRQGPTLDKWRHGKE